jgi:beta-N-acetylhexosaminidase
MLIYYLLLFSLCFSYELFEPYYKEAEKILQNLTIEERIGQMFFPRFSLENYTDDIKNRRPGGYVLFAYDFNYDEKYIQNYIKDIQKLSMENVGIPLGLSVDEEGGGVTRVSKYHRDERFPYPQEIYNEEGIEGVLKIDQEKRDLLRKFYLNINLAPVADVSYNDSDYIYYRTLGKEPKETADYIARDVEGYVDDNFTCCLKHFPGYGNNVDTHGEIGIDKRDYTVFENEDFLPFKAGISKDVPMILVSHNIVLCKDPDFPASISEIWHEILRNELHYSGLILTDDMSMAAIKKFTNNESEAVLAVLAGNDIILTSDYYQHYDAVIKAYNEGKINEDIINIACRRILAWKIEYGILAKLPPVPETHKMIKKLEESHLYDTKMSTLSIIGNLLFDKEVEASFVAGILANIYHGENIGRFESSSNYDLNPEEKPDYLKYMDDIYDYKYRFSNKLITEISTKELGQMLNRLKKDNWQKGKFGLGCVQWRGERTYKLFELYKQESDSIHAITTEQATLAEGKMFINEFRSNYTSVYYQWQNENKNKNKPLAAYRAGHNIYTKYVNEKEDVNRARIRARTARDMYITMTS